MKHEVLVLDRAGSPSRWIAVELAATYYARAMVLGDCGERTFELRGGWSRATGRRSVLSVSSIVLLEGERVPEGEHRRGPPVERELLFRRDRHVCAYCGDRFQSRGLSMDHVYPESRGGTTRYGNLVTACIDCNQRKDSRTPEEAKMPLLYLPYVPSRHECFILSARNILADQMGLLLARVPKGSRLHS